MTNIIKAIEKGSITKAGHLTKGEVIIGIIRTLQVGATIKMAGIEVNIIQVIKETLRIETGHMTELEAGIEKIQQDIGGIEEIVDLGEKV